MGQKNQLWWDLPAADSFQLHREIYSLPAAEFKQTLGELTELLGVEKLTRQPVRELSLGERMKMELIAALLHQPQLLLLDEPTIGLDVVAQVAIQKCLREYHARRGVTMLLTSHYMRDVEALCYARAGHHARQARLRRPAGGHHRAVRPRQAGASCSSPTATRPRTSTASARSTRREGPVGRPEGRARRGWPRCWGRSSTATPWPT